MNSIKDFQPNFFHPYYFIRGQLYQKIREYAPRLYGNVLDFGCGAKPYKKLFEHCHSYIGVDFEGTGHSHANEEIDFFYDGRKLPFENERFDCIFTSEVFEHLFNLEELLPELARVMKGSGKILITCPFVWPEHEKPYDFARYTLFALTSLLEKNGFRIVKTDKTGNFFMAVQQMKIAYVYHHVCGKFSFNNKLPFLAKLMRSILTPIMNLGVIVGNAVLPKNKELYLNNIVLAEKIS
jgi:SAM-dependent methyltransferase